MKTLRAFRSRWAIDKVLTLALAAGVGSAVAVESARPNIVVLVADDWGFSDLGAFGGEIETPHLDQLARQGVRFSSFHTAASCAPTRSMLLTGVDNHLNGVGNLRETMPRSHLGKPGYLGSLDTNVVTIATLLQDSGYRTYITGKWNVGSEPHNLPNRRGFDRSIIQADTGSDNWVPSQRYLPHSATVKWFEDGREAEMPAEFYSSQFFVDKALDYLRSGAQSRKPFFAYIGFQANHVPVQAPKAFVDKYRGRYQDGWVALRKARRDKAAALGLIPQDTAMRTMSTVGDWSLLSEQEKRYQARQMEVYAAMADAMDEQVGRLVSYLKASGDFDNTVFVFLSDNGAEGSDYKDAQLWIKTQYTQDMEQLGAKGAYGIPGPGWASASVSPLNTYKFYAGEGGIRVPMFISGVPGMTKNQIYHGLTHVTDIAPTLLDLAQLPNPGTRYRGQIIERMNGLSLLPLLKSQAQGVHPPEQAIGYELSGNLALFKGDLKLVKNNAPMGDGQWHLYDIRKDPGEVHDLRQQLPDVFQRLQVDYENYAASHGVLPMPAGYNPVRQVLINTIFNYWIPSYWMLALSTLSGLTVLVLGVKRWRKRRITS